MYGEENLKNEKSKDNYLEKVIRTITYTRGIFEVPILTFRFC